MHYSPYLEAPSAPYPPEYDEPEVSKQEVIDVFFGRAAYDGVGRNHEDLMCDTSMASFWERVTTDDEAEREMRMLVWAHLLKLPRTRAILNELAAAATKE